MEVSARRAFALLKSLAFERLSGSDAEKCAAETLLAEAQGCGVDAHIEEFSVPCGRVGSARLVVTAPYQKEYAVHARGRPGRGFLLCRGSAARAPAPCKGQDRYDQRPPAPRGL